MYLHHHRDQIMDCLTLPNDRIKLEFQVTGSNWLTSNFISKDDSVTGQKIWFSSILKTWDLESPVIRTHYWAPHHTYLPLKDILDCSKSNAYMHRLSGSSRKVVATTEMLQRSLPHYERCAKKWTHYCKLCCCRHLHPCVSQEMDIICLCSVRATIHALKLQCSNALRRWKCALYLLFVRARVCWIFWGGGGPLPISLSDEPLSPCRGWVSAPNSTAAALERGVRKKRRHFCTPCMKRLESPLTLHPTFL